MPKFRVYYSEIHEGVIDIEAASVEEAKDKYCEAHRNGQLKYDIVSGAIDEVAKLAADGKLYTWKDIVAINGVCYAEEFPISGKKDGDEDDAYYQLDDFYEAVAEKYGVDTDDIETYMMDGIEFDQRVLAWGAEDCGCYIDGTAEWLIGLDEESD